MNQTTKAKHTASATIPKDVTRRKVYYVAGFDPRGAGYYHRLYREESAKQAAHHDGASISVGQRAKLAPLVSAWNVDSRWDGHDVETTYHYLHWDDLVRRHWQGSLLRVIMAAVRDYGYYIRCGALGRLKKTFRGPYFSAVYPMAYLALLLLLAIACGVGVGSLLGVIGLASGWAWAGGIAAGAAVGAGGIALANRLAVFWLLRTYCFVQAWGAREPIDVMARVDALAEWIRLDQQASPSDEVLLVGHSVGSILAVSIAARLTALLSDEQRGRITLVTLGQCIPLLSLMPTAKPFHHDLGRLADERAMSWLDMNARADALCFSQANPLDVSGIRGGGRPTAQVVRPFKMFDKRTYARMKLNRQRMHFQYLMASALPNEYDYFRMTAGPSRIQPF